MWIEKLGFRTFFLLKQTVILFEILQIRTFCFTITLMFFRVRIFMRCSSPQRNLGEIVLYSTLKWALLFIQIYLSVFWKCWGVLYLSVWLLESWSILLNKQIFNVQNNFCKNTYLHSLFSQYIFNIEIY